MNILAWVVIGSLAGWLAGIVANPRNRLGRGSHVAVGIIGALIGGWLVTLLGNPNMNGIDPYGMAFATFCSIVLLGLAEAFQRPVLR